MTELRKRMIECLQRETWTKTARGWKLKFVDNIRIQSMTVDGKPVRPNVLYDLSDPLYISVKQRRTGRTGIKRGD